MKNIRNSCHREFGALIEPRLKTWEHRNSPKIKVTKQQFPHYSSEALRFASGSWIRWIRFGPLDSPKRIQDLLLPTVRHRISSSGLAVIAEWSCHQPNSHIQCHGQGFTASLGAYLLDLYWCRDQWLVLGERKILA